MDELFIAPVSKYLFADWGSRRLAAYPRATDDVQAALSQRK